MPKGQKLVDWQQPGNDTKLLLSIVKTHKIDYDKIAAEFGAPRTAITTRISTMRKKAGGGLPSKSLVSVARPSPVKVKAGGSKPKTVSSRDNDEEVSGFQNGNAPNHSPASPKNDSDTVDKTLGGRVTKNRNSPRKSVKADYSKLNDPYKANTMSYEMAVSTDEGDAESSEDESYNIAQECMTPGVKFEAEDMGI